MKITIFIFMYFFLWLMVIFPTELDEVFSQNYTVKY